MRVLVCPDSFKGTLSARDAARTISRAFERVLFDVECVCVPLSDGGEGAMSVVAGSLGAQTRTQRVTGPKGEMVAAQWAIARDGRGFIELAEASGLELVKEAPSAIATTSFGTGELVRAALDADVRDLTLAIGGSATNDGGMGLLSALGVRFFDENGHELKGSGRDLCRVFALDASGLDPRIEECAVHVLCDVDNPLLGPEGATFTFGAQKGASPKELRQLEAGMERFSHLVAQALGRDFSRVPGAGAAGGVGFATMAFLGAQIESGVDGILDLVGFDELLATVDLVITGEGHADAQTLHGKVISGVARRCARDNVFCVALVGAMDESALVLLDAGVNVLVPTVIDANGPEEALAFAERNLRLAAERIASLIAFGKGIGG